MNIGLWILVVIGGAAGLLSTLYLTLALPVILVWKAYRHFRYGLSMFE